MRINYKSILISAGIIIIAILLRVLFLNKDSLWLDEGYSCIVALLPFHKMLSMSLSDTNMLVHPVILHFWLKLMGGIPESGRILSAIIGILTVPAAIVLYRKLFGKSWIVPAILIACSPYLIYFSQEIRCYALFLLLGLLSNITFLNAFNTGKRRHFLSYITVSVLMIFTHIYGVFVPFAHFLFVVLYHKESAISIKKSLFLFGIPYSSLLLYLPFLLSKQTELALRQKQGVTNLLLVFADFSGGIPVAILIFISICVVSIMLRRQILRICRERQIAFLLLLILSNTLIPFLISLTILPVFADRYTVNASIPFLFLVFAIVMRLKNKILQNIIITIIVTATLSMTIVRTQVPTREPWREVGEELKKELNASGTTGLIVGDEWCYDYALKLYFTYNQKLLKVAQEKYTSSYPDTSTDFKTLCQSNNEIFMIAAHFPGAPDLKNVIEKSFKQVESKDYFYFDRYFRKNYEIQLFHFKRE